MHVDMGDSPPICQKPYTLPLKHYSWVQQEIETLECVGVIKKSISPWASPIVMVPKNLHLVKPLLDVSLTSIREKLLDNPSLKLSAICSCDSTSSASLEASWTVLGGFLISVHLLAILFLMFLLSGVTKSLMMWGCLPSFGQMPDDLRSAHPPFVSVNSDGLIFHLPHVTQFFPGLIHGGCI